MRPGNDYGYGNPEYCDVLLPSDRVVYTTALITYSPWARLDFQSNYYGGGPFIYYGSGYDSYSGNYSYGSLLGGGYGGFVGGYYGGFLPGSGGYGIYGGGSNWGGRRISHSAGAKTLKWWGSDVDMFQVCIFSDEKLGDGFALCLVLCLSMASTIFKHNGL